MENLALTICVFLSVSENYAASNMLDRISLLAISIVVFCFRLLVCGSLDVVIRQE